MRISMLLIGSLAALGATGCRSDDNRSGPVAKAVEKQERKAEPNEGRVTSKDGAQIAFEKAGRGPALILVSGALAHREMLRGNPLVPKLAETFTVYTYDRRGRGESTNVKPYAVEREVEDIDALIAHAGRPVYLFGVSSGAALTLQAAAKLGPSKVTKIALYEVPFGQEPDAYAKQKQGVAKLIETGQPGEAAEFFLSSIGTPREALDGMKRSPQWAAMKTMDYTLDYDFAILGDGSIPKETARAITVPALVLTGDKIPWMLPASDELAMELPGGRRKTLPGQTHQVQADVVVPLLVEFYKPAL
jgi:pimeloyl-ACP methyl ester carboxylesterase